MSSHKHSRFDLADVHERLRHSQGPRYWRSLEELAQTEAFQEYLQREFPEHASEWTNPITRRRFLTLMGASLALAGVHGCAPAPPEKIVPYVRQPELVVPGKPLFFATAMTLGGVATGILVENHEGRPTKVEGNPDHPASLGATDAFAQASILTLYDPDRSRTVTYLGRIRAWSEGLAALQSVLARQRPRHGAGVRVLTETVTSPTLGRQFQQLLQDLPAAKWHQYDPAQTHAAQAGAQLAFGENVHTYYDFRQADVILSLDADFLSCGPGHLRYVHDFMNRRRVWAGQAAMNRLYLVESTFTPTGGVADHRLALRAAQVEDFARALAARLGLPVRQAAAALDPPQERWLEALLRDLQAHRGTSVIFAGDQQPPAVHALAHALNHTLGNLGTTVLHTPPLAIRPVDPIASLRGLVEDMERRQVELLVIVSGNPVFTAPVDLHFGERLDKVPLRLHLSLYQDETSQRCHWHIPEAHYLESWGDARAYDGTASIVQPLIAPLYGGKSAHELLAAFADQPDRPGYDIVRDYWRGYWQQQGTGTFEQFWETALHDGVVAGTRLPMRPVSLQEKWAEQPVLARPARARAIDPGQPQLTVPPATAANLEIVFRPDPTLYDGCFANNGWLQELPKPVTRLTWDNAAILSPRTAEELGLSSQIGRQGGSHGQLITDLVELHYRGRMVRAPVWIQPGHPDYSITIHFGHGRTRAGKVGTGTGFNAYALRASDQPWFDDGLQLRQTGERYTLACVQHHHLMEGRDVVRSGTLERYRENPHFLAAVEDAHAAEPAGQGRQPLSLYPEYPYEGYTWGMAIDLSACVGCGACVVACQAENNIPIVGKEEVTRGREMHWLRVDAYYEGDRDQPRAYFQPVPCMHCEKAPCEVVCPVAATVHSSDGLNDMVYNRCVGTRYCSNNCPYKVRRFNFFQYADYATESLKLMRNPEVTVRSRGVMEKCTYCVQRIRNGEIEAKKEDRRIRDGEVTTACQAACPAQAIIFGDINDRTSQVARRKATPLNYGLLADLNTQPRTTYLAALRNPNPEFEMMAP